jgi:hypothetical protein
MYLEGPSQKDIIGVIALLDLYGPTFYPKKTALERYHWAKLFKCGSVAFPKRPTLFEPSPQIRYLNGARVRLNTAKILVFIAIRLNKLC